MRAPIFGYICDCDARIRPKHIPDLQTETREERQMVQSAADCFREAGRAEDLEKGR